MSDFGLFESDEATQAEPRLAARTAARKMEAAIDAVRTEFGRFLLGATGIDEFGDRWHYSKHDIRKAVEPYVFPNTGTMRRIHNALKQDWKLAHPYKLASDSGMSNLELGERSYDESQAELGDMYYGPGRSGPKFSEEYLRKHPERFPHGHGLEASRRQALSHDEAGYGQMETDNTRRNQDLDETYHPSSGNLIPSGDFEGWKDSVDQGGPEKVQRAFTPGGDSGSDRTADRHHLPNDREYGFYHSEDAPGGPWSVYREEYPVGDFSKEGEPVDGSQQHVRRGIPSEEEAYKLTQDLYRGNNDFESGGGRHEAARLVADIYTDFARANGLRVASLDTLDAYASTGIAPADYRLLASMIVRTAECDEDCDDDSDDDSDSEAGSEAPSDSESDDSGSDDDSDEDPDFGGESGSEGEDESDEDGDGDHDDDDHHTDDDFGGGAGGQTFTVPEEAPELDPQLQAEIPTDDPGGSAPIPPEVIDSLLGLPEGTIEQLLLEEVQKQGLGGGEPQAGPPQGGGDDFFGEGGGESEQEPPRVARRRQAKGPVCDDCGQHYRTEGHADNCGEDLNDSDSPLGSDGSTDGDVKDYLKRKRSSARRFWAADDESSSSDSSGGGDSGGGGGQQAAPQQDPNAMMGGGQQVDPAAMGMGQPMLPPPGSQAVQPPAPAMPLENQPAEDALLDTANQAIMQMIDRETQEYQQIIDPLSQALQAIQFAQQVEQAEHPLDVTPPQGSVDVSPAAAPGGAANPMQPTAGRRQAAVPYGEPDRRKTWDWDKGHRPSEDSTEFGDVSHDGVANKPPAAARSDRQAKIRTALRGAARVIAQKYRLSATGERMLLEAMGRRNYEHVREALSLVPPEVRKPAAIHMGEMFAADNPRFNKDVWMRSVLASNPRDRAGDAWRDGRDRGVAEHGRQDLDDFGDDLGSAFSSGGNRHHRPGGFDPNDHDEWVDAEGWNDRTSSRGRRPFDRPRTAGETWTNTPVKDAFEFPNAGEVPRVDDGIAVNNLPGMEGADPHAKNASVRQAADIVKKLQNWLSQQQARGLNYGGDVAAEGFLKEHPKVGPRATQVVHQTVGAEPHPPSANPAPKVKAPKAINPVTRKSTRQASFFTRKVPGWRWDDHMNGYLSKEGRAFTCSCGEPVAAPSYKNCKCGKIWNVYAIGDVHHLGSNTAEQFIAREIPVRPGVVMANRKLAEMDPRVRNDLLQAVGDEITTIGEYANFYQDAQQSGDDQAAAALAESLHDEREHMHNFADALGEPGMGGDAGTAQMLAMIDKLADWTKYDGPDPAREGGPKKPPSTAIPKQPRDWAKRDTDGTWQGPAIPRKKK